MAPGSTRPASRHPVNKEFIDEAPMGARIADRAAYAAPLILLAGNRSAERDRLTLEHAASETDVEEKQNERLLSGNTEILKHVQKLDERILELEQRIMAAIKAGG